MKSALSNRPWYFAPDVAGFGTAGKGGYKLLARKFGVAESMVRRWVAAYRHHGNAGLIRQRCAYTLEFKLEVLHRGVVESLSRRELAAIYNISNPHSVTTWQQQKARRASFAKGYAPVGAGFFDASQEKDLESVLESQGVWGIRPAASRESAVARGGRVPKKIQCLGSSKEVGATERAKIVLELRQEFLLADLLHASGLPRSTYYYQVKTLAAPDRYGGLKAKGSGCLCSTSRLVWLPSRLLSYPQ
jgi:transposase-like protein